MYPSFRSAPDIAAMPGIGDAAPRQRRGVAAGVVLLGLTSLLTDISSELLAAILPLYLTLQLGLSPLALGFIDGTYHGVTVLVRIGGGIFADRSRRPKLVATAGYAMSAAAKLALLPIAAIPAIAAVIAVDRAGKGIRTAPRDALIAAHSSPESFGLAFGVHRAMDAVGALLGPLLAFALLAAMPNGYDTALVTSFCFALLGLAVLVLLVTDVRGSFAASSRVNARSVIGLLGNRQYRRSLVGACALAALTVGDGFLYLIIQQRGKIAPELFPLLFVGTATIYLLLAVPFGRFADRVGRHNIFIAGHVALLGAYISAGMGTIGPPAVVVCVILLGVYYAATDGVLSALAVPLLPQNLRSSGLAGVQTAVAAGRVVAALLFGALWTFASDRTALCVFGVALACALPVARRLFVGTGRHHE